MNIFRLEELTPEHEKIVLDKLPRAHRLGLKTDSVDTQSDSSEEHATRTLSKFLSGKAIAHYLLLNFEMVMHVSKGNLVPLDKLGKPIIPDYFSRLEYDLALWRFKRKSIVSPPSENHSLVLSIPPTGSMNVTSLKSLRRNVFSCRPNSIVTKR